MKNLLLTLLVFSTISFSAKAGLLIEPYLNFMDNTTYEQGNTTIDSDGMSFGARVGYKFAGFWLAADIESGTSKTAEFSNGDTGDLKISNTALAAGVSLIPMLNLYLKYYISAKHEIGDDSDTIEGGGTAFGIGWSVIPMLSINVEYRNISLDEVDGNSLTTAIDNKGLVLGVSVPFSL